MKVGTARKLQWGVQVAGTVDGKGGDREWTCEMALPIEDVVTAPHRPPQPGDRWRMNLFRVERMPAAAELAWSPTLQKIFTFCRASGKLFSTNKKVFR
jgi:hypothetical protein